VKLRWRFTLTLALAALVPITVAAVVTRQVIAARYVREYQARQASAEESMRRELDRLSKQVQAATTSLTQIDLVKNILTGIQNGTLARSLRNYQRQSRVLMEGLSLDVFEVVGPDPPVTVKEVALIKPHLPGDAETAEARPLRALAAKFPNEVFYTFEDIKREGQAITEVLVGEAVRIAVDDQSSYTVPVLGGRAILDDILESVRGRQQNVDLRVIKRATGVPILAAKHANWDTFAADSPRRIDLPGPDGQPVATIEIAVSDPERAGLLRALTYTSAGLALAALAAVVLIGLLVARRTSRDLDALVVGSLAASRGELEHRVPVRSRDEIGAVADAFNFMMEDLKVSKERLVIAERIAAWQEIARRLAHEIKNPLTPIQMAMDTLRKSWKKQHPSFEEILEESTSSVLQEADRLKHIVTEFSDFARMPKPSFVRLDLNEVIRSALTLYQGAVPIATKLTDKLPQIDADRGQVNQVVINLVENARDAIGKRPDGRITVSTRLGEAGDRVTILVDDNGPGIPVELKDKVFAPYFTTKHAKGGTGLGLAIVHRIVSDHGGRIQVMDAPGGGARFLIELPLRNGTALLASRI
jgi:two-component system, NtrC family, nitrogen regulation sensor histidine kinase NtrY